MANLLSGLINQYTDSEGHILYYYKNAETYLENVVHFLREGVESGSHIMLVENDRNLIEINKRLKLELSENERTQVHYINNFDFYYANKCFSPEAVVQHFLTNIGPYINNDVPVWTWGLVEWGDDKEITSDIENYEKQLHKLVKEKGLISVCAYDANRTPETLKPLLMKCHTAMLTEDEVTFLVNSPEKGSVM